MAIRKTGAVTGQVTEAEQVPQEGIDADGAIVLPGIRISGSATGKTPGWSIPDEHALSDENRAADGE